MLDKIQEVSQHDTELMVRNSIRYGGTYTPQRIASLQIDFKDFLNHPILGYGGFMEARWTKKLGANISTISGIGKILARFGIIGTFFFLFSLFKTSRSLQSIYSFRGWIFFILLILVISFSYSIIELPILLCFWLFYLFGIHKENNDDNFSDIKLEGNRSITQENEVYF
jgi:hypothetical protein